MEVIDNISSIQNYAKLNDQVIVMLYYLFSTQVYTKHSLTHFYVFGFCKDLDRPSWRWNPKPSYCRERMPPYLATPGG